MGYMGFGMQKWIYSRKPRKYMSREMRKESTDTVYNEHHSKTIFDGDPETSSLRTGDPLFVNRELKYKRIRKIIYIAVACVIILFYFILKFSK